MSMRRFLWPTLAVLRLTGTVVACEFIAFCAAGVFRIGMSFCLEA